MNALHSPEIQEVATTAEQAEPRYRTAKIEIDPTELRFLLQRAVNTLEPSQWPKWVEGLMGNRLHKGPDGKQYLDKGILATDQCTFTLRRKVD